MEPPKTISTAFYRSQAGREPVREWLKSLEGGDKKSIGVDIRAIELSWPVGLPLVRKLDSDLWEIRSRLRGRTARIFFTVWEKNLVLLHGIIKKTQRTPLEDLDLARKRRNEVQRGGIE